MAHLPSECPSCGAHLRVTHLACSHCETHLDGVFALPNLLRLSAEELAFVVEFVRTSGSLKEMARIRKQSYPTIRNRLDEVIAKLETDDSAIEKKRQGILDAIAKGKLSVGEGAKRLREVGR